MPMTPFTTHDQTQTEICTEYRNSNETQTHGQNQKAKARNRVTKNKTEGVGIGNSGERTERTAIVKEKEKITRRKV